MSLAEMEVKCRKESFEQFIVAVWEGAEPPQLLTLARAAGLSGEEADAIVARVAQAKEQVAGAQRLPRLRKDSAALNAQHDKLKGRASAEISRLEAEMRDAALEADAAQRVVYEAEEAARQLLALYDRGEMPGVECPEEIFILVERRDAEEHTHQMVAARVAAENHRNSIRDAIRNMEFRLHNLPVSVTSDHEAAVLEKRLTDARRQLAEAESALRTAVAAEEAARREIP